MIQRWYFISGRKCNYDGSGGSSHAYAHFTIRSWFEDKNAVFNRGSGIIRNILEDKPGDQLVIAAFNRC